MTTKNLPISLTDFNRQVAITPTITFQNRFLEANPALNSEPVSAVSRPGMRKFLEVGTGPVRKVFSSPGVFQGDLFVVSGTVLYRVDAGDLSVSTLGTISVTDVGDVSMCTTAPLDGVAPAFLFLAEGGVLWMYTEDGYALGHLEVDTSISDGDVVEINGVYYEFTTGSVDTGTPAGTSDDPWLVFHTGLTPTTLQNLYNAVNASGIEGTDYSTGLEIHPTVQAISYSAADLYVQALSYGSGGNSYTTSTTGSGISWEEGANFAGGGLEQLRQVQVPDDIGAISVAHINSYVIVVPVQSDDLKGRFYYIQPGTNVIEPLDYATAERNPDGVLQVLVYGDLFWLLGENTTEPWTITGTAESPVQRYQGILFDRGSWEGTAVQVKDSLIVVDEDGGVFQIAGGQTRISRPDIEERIRRAKQIEATA